VKIRRQRRPNRYTVLDNKVIYDTRLSWRALGLLAYLLSKPDGWETDAQRLAALRKEGRDAVRSALNEIEAAGYLVRRRFQNERGQWITETLLNDEPKSGFQASVNQALLVTTDSKDGSLRSRAVTETR
jgi:hypothetical protein